MVERHVQHHRNVFNKCVGVTKDQVEGISFCSAMQGLVLVDKAGNCIRPPHDLYGPASRR